MKPIWIVDDDQSIRFVLEKALAREQFATRSFSNPRDVLSALDDDEPQVLVSDIRMPGGSGIDLLGKVKARLPGLPVIIMTAYSDLDSAVSAFQGGAFEYLPKPFDLTRAVELIRRAVEESLREEVRDLGHAEMPEMLGQAPAMQDVFRAIGRLSQSNVTVLITGESGSGKELVARALHKHSPRGDAGTNGPFIAINTAAIPKDLLESELFGHERGAFTGAVAKKRGLFEVADGGTMFLDEIGDMTLSAQAKVLRVLQTGEFTRVGGEKSLRTDCRVVAATNRDLEQMVKDGSFREDLFFRLNVVPIRSPDLKERTEDIPLLVEAFVRECCEENGLGYKPVDEAVFDVLRRYEWPGNVRELRNVVERLVIMSDEVIREKDIPPYLGGPRGAAPASRPALGETAIDLGRYAGKSLREFREEVESEFIRIRLAEFDWNISRTAQALGIERTNLHKKLRALGIHRGESE